MSVSMRCRSRVPTSSLPARLERANAAPTVRSPEMLKEQCQVHAGVRSSGSLLRMLVAFAWVVVGCSGFETVRSATVTWAGATTGVQDWFVTGNWVPARVPEPGDDVRIEGNVASLQVVLNRNVTVRSLANSAILRAVANLASFTILEVSNGLTNRGEIRLESERADRSSHLWVRPGGVMENTGKLTAVAQNGGQRLFTGTLVNRGIVHSERGMTLEMNMTDAQFVQVSGVLQAEGSIFVNRGRVRFEGGVLQGDIRLFGPDLSITDGMVTPAEVSVLGLGIRFRGNASPTFKVHVTTDTANFSTLTADNGAINVGRLVLDSGRSDRASRIELGANFRNAPSGVIEVVAGGGSDRSLNGSLVNQGQVLCSHPTATFTGTYRTEGGTVEGNLTFVNATIIPSSNPPQATELRLLGNQTVLKGNNPENLTLRVVSDVGNFSILTVDSNMVNQGTISLESIRADRPTRLHIPAGTSLVNRGTLRAIGTEAGDRIVRGGIVNQGNLDVAAGILLTLENGDATLSQQSGSIRVLGALNIVRGKLDLLGGEVAGTVRCYDVEHRSARTMSGSTFIDVLGLNSRLVSNESAGVTYHLTSDINNFTTLQLLSGGVNRGRILQGAGRADRGTRILMDPFNTNLSDGVIEVVAEAGGSRELSGYLVNQGRLVCTNYPAVFHGTYQSSGGVLEGAMRFENATITQDREAPHDLDFLLFGPDSVLLGDNLQSHRLHVISDVGNFSTLTLSSNAVNRGFISLESLRSDRTSFLKGLDGVLRNGVTGKIVAGGTNGGGRELVGALQNLGRLRLENPLRIQAAGAAHRNSGVIQLGGLLLDVDGATFVNQEAGRIAGSGTLDVSGVSFSNAGGIYPGASPGRLRVIGNYTQTDTGLLDVEIAGDQGAGVGHDVLEVASGKVTLNGGRLSARLLDGFVPAANALYRVVTAQQGVTGRFSRLTTVQVHTNRYLELAYSANAVDLQARSGSVSNQPPSIALQPESLDVDLDSAVEFRVSVDGTGPFTYQWRFKGNPVQGASTDRLSIARAQVKDLGNYDVVVSNAYGSATSQSARLSFKLQNGKGGTSCDTCDFGDAPDSYGTSLANDGARHPTEFPTGPYVTLGATVDTEANSLGNSAASLDDTIPAAGPDDENGVAFTAPIQAGRSNEVRVAVVLSGYEFAYLSAWLDMADDGTFGNGDDFIIRSQEVHSGLNIFKFWIPSNSSTVSTHARFRLVGVNTQGDIHRLLGPTGLANNGEVEDYPVTITAGTGEPGGGTGGGDVKLDFGDAPNSYLTTLAVNGPRHASDYFKPNQPSYVMLGKVIDLETDGAPTASATGDDTPTVTQVDDEEGVQFLDPLYAGKPFRVQVIVTSRGYANRFLNAWIDYGMNGTFTDATDKVISGMVLAEGTNVVTLQVPPGTPVGNTFSRFRITGSNDPNSPLRTLDPTGLAENGEVEDHAVSISEPLRDFGDAPESPGSIATTLAKNGPWHWIVPGVYLGKRVDGETDGKPSAQAKGDDNAGVDDEDGVVFSGALTVGGVVAVEVTASVPGRLEGWIDFNGNRSWADAGENVFQSVSLTAGVNTLSVSIPPNAVIGEVFARFRFSTQGNYGLLGEAADGEVEDYKLTIEQSAQCDLSCNGSDFWLAFPGNQFPDPAYPLLAQLRVVGTPGNTVNVAIPGIGSNIVAVIGANGIANVALPNEVDLGSLNDAVLNRGIHVTSSGKAVSVYAVSRVQYTSDGYLGLPVDALGTEYVVGAYPNLHVGIPELSGSQFVITATRPNTTVTITPASETGVRVGKVPYSLMLTNAGDCYQLRSLEDAPADLTGSIIEADQPVAVFGGHQCTDVNSSSLFFCDYLVEQIPPVNRLGSEFFAAPFATRSVGDTVRVVASRDLTTLSVDGSPVVLTNKGDVYTLFRTSPTWITSDKPVYAAQYASSSDLDGVTNADPFMVTLPGRSLFSKDITFATAGINFSEHYISIVAPEITTTVTLDGVATSPSFTPIGTSGFHYAHVKVSQGLHTLSASKAMGVIVYGWSQFASYAWPACLYFGDTTPPVVHLLTNRITRSLPANESTCVVTLPDLRPGVSVTDNCNLPLDVLITQTPAPGTSVGVGSHRVSFSVRDAAGNEGTANLEYVVTNTGGDRGAILDCPSDLTVRCQSLQGSIVTFAPSGTLNCEPARVESVPASGSLFPVGTTPVTVRLFDGNTVVLVCQFNVTVTCAKRLQLKVKPPAPGGPAAPTELMLDFDPGENIVEVAEALEGPWVRIVDATPGMIIKIEREKGRFYRIR